MAVKTSYHKAPKEEKKVSVSYWAKEEIKAKIKTYRYFVVTKTENRKANSIQGIER